MPGFVFYSGKGLIDGQPIVGIATWGSGNIKTGDLIQTWILRSDMHPMQAVSDGSDVSICGNCPLRGLIKPASERISKNSKIIGDTANKGRSCYVLIQNAPTQIYKSYVAGNYPVLDDSCRKYMMGKGLRYGSYGDPVAIPMKYWDDLKKYCTGSSMPGYTHQWRNKKFAGWKNVVMASTHSLSENELAKSMGWRTFRTIVSVSDKSDTEIICPASAEGGYKSNCASCGACDGRRSDADVRHSVAIVGHGSAKIGNLNKVIAAS